SSDSPDSYAVIISCNSSGVTWVPVIPVGVTTGPRTSVRGTDTLEPAESSPGADAREINDFRAANEDTVSSRLGHEMPRTIERSGRGFVVSRPQGPWANSPSRYGRGCPGPTPAC